MRSPNGGMRFGQRAEAVVVKAAARPRAEDRTIKMKRVPLRVEMPKGAEGIIYPPFNQIAPGFRKGLSWDQYVDLCGGWFYDKCCGHGEVDEYNPDPETWFGVILVDPEFAEEAVRLFPARCKALTEAEFQEFHDDRCRIREPKEHISAERILQIRAKYGIPEGVLKADDSRITDKEDRDAINPEHPAPGIVRNRKKKLSDLKVRMGFEIDESTVTKLRKK